MPTGPIDDLHELRWRAEENLRDSYRTMARCSADGAVMEADGAYHIATGVPNAFFNPVFLNPLYAPPDDVDGFLRRVRAFYAARGGLPWSLLLPHYDDSEPTLTCERLADAGVVAAGSVPLLTRPTPRSRDTLRGNRDIHIERVGDGETLSDHRGVLGEAFGLPGYVTEMLLPDLPPPTTRLYVAYLGREAVGTASLFESAGVAGIYNVSVMPAYRRKGTATMLLRHVLDEACWECGLSDTITQAPRLVWPLFRALGFRRLGICTRYVEPKHLPPGESQKRT